MNRKSRQIKDANARPAWKLAATISVAALFAACDGANQGVQIGTGQNPDPVVIDFPIAYVKQPIPVDDNGEFEQQDLREQITFQVGWSSSLRFRFGSAGPRIEKSSLLPSYAISTSRTSPWSPMIGSVMFTSSALGDARSR